MRLEAILLTLLAGCAAEQTAEQRFYHRIERYGDHREMRTAGGHDAVWNLLRVQHIFQENGLNENAPHDYAFTFVDSRPAPLRDLSRELEIEGYHLARLELVPEDGQWWMEIKKNEVHTAASLHGLNVRFSKLGEAHGVLYYGWNVERQ